LAFKGSLELGGETKDLWRNFQSANRARQIEVPDNRPDSAHALASEPTHVLKVAALFELATATAAGRRQKQTIGVQSLQLAIEHVAQNLRASDHLFHRAQQLESVQAGEEILAKIRSKFLSSKTYPDTIFVNRTTLTATFCHHTDRRGALSTEELYLQILPELIRQGQTQLCAKKGKLEIYGFRVSDSDSVPGIIFARDTSPPAEANSANSTPPRAQGPSTIDAHNCTFKNNILYAGGGVEFVETAENTPSSPREVDLFGAYLALDLETCAEPKVARRGVPRITTSRDALNPFKGEIRLLTLADQDGNIRSFDFRELENNSKIPN
jgi:hypothetical protein